MGNTCSSAPEPSFAKVLDKESGSLSYVGTAAYDELSSSHAQYFHQLWNISTGVPVGKVQDTPSKGWESTQDPSDGHDAWFPERMCEIMSKTQVWCDVTSLGPPDGQFLVAFKKALGNIAKNARGKAEPIVVRMMFGNIVAMPVDCDALVTSLTQDLDEDNCNILLWVGAWRKGVTWNHAKIIAVDGFHLHTGGHNLWDKHYLSNNPVHDISMELQGKIAHDGHLYANQQWAIVEQTQNTFLGRIIKSLPDNMPMTLPTRVTITEWPSGVADEFPPMYDNDLVPSYEPVRGRIPMISMGRYGAMLPNARCSDDAIVAMFDSARKVIHLALQDLGPITLPSVPGPVAVPSCVWPKVYMAALARGIWERDVHVEIAVSNPGSVPGGLKPTEALYGNGWTCDQVASAIITQIVEQFEDVDDVALRRKVLKNLRVSYVRSKQGNAWANGGTLGMHAKHFIVDDIAYYIGSQNLYIADLAEWGVVIDNAEQTKKVMNEYWNPLWRASYNPKDCDENKVMDGLGIDRDGDDLASIDDDGVMSRLMEQAHRASHGVPADSPHHHDSD